MYVPGSFEEKDPAELVALIESNGFATLVTPHDGGLEISHLPLLLERTGDRLSLVGHVARANRHWKAMAYGVRSTAIFHGPHGYISPVWYRTAPSVPTWNYAVVHAVGPCRVRDDEEFKVRAVTMLAERHEGDDPRAWRMDRLPAAYLKKQIHTIVAFELEIETMAGKFKLGQNRTAEDQAGASDGLERTGIPGDRELARLMREREARR